MRNDSEKWTPALGLVRPAFSVPGFEMQMILPRRQTLISGTYSSAVALAGVGAAIGWPDKVAGGSYALRLRRDRVLVVNGPALADGWHDAEGLAVSDMTDGYAVIEIGGAHAMGVLMRGTEISPDEPSASVVRGYAGYGTLIYAGETEGRFRIHVARSFLDGLWDLLSSFAQQIDG